ncbi:hypothetical protein [Dyadobacter arcticus]|uniref:Uncharacterized protein n=1 Tax=Dyadobacter arcticus TaxID=1078754 RepID=A0ABX0USL5_9BACT|nr:hypothetical protein [Dyadobacter arcticus]NIJ54750.1 hypothetical protein [Dyadobacter arcticus]
MEKVIKRKKAADNPKHPLDRQFSSPEEGAQAKTDYVMTKVFKNADWSSLKK